MLKKREDRGNVNGKRSDESVLEFMSWGSNPLGWGKVKASRKIQLKL